MNSSSPHLAIDLPQRNALPGGSIAGTLQWNNLSEVSSLQVRLFWVTENRKGGRDIAIIETVTFPISGPSGQSPFQFKLPDGPYTFQGKLLNLQWGVEALAGKQASRDMFTLGPGGAAIILTEVPDPAPAGGSLGAWIKQRFQGTGRSLEVD
jgi:hypothetical protein